MADLRRYITINCISFTVVVLINAVLGIRGNVELNNTTILQIFFLITCVSVVMFFTDRIPIKSQYAAMLVQILDIFFVVIIFGVFIFGQIPFDIYHMLILSGVLLLTYFAVYGVTMIKEQADANEINKKILEMKAKKGEGGDS